MIHLFRHTDAGRRSDWDESDQERPLTELGRTQAVIVAKRLMSLGVGRILSSPYMRCIQSVEPLSEATGIPIEVEPALAEGAPDELVEALLADVEPGTVLCSHGDVVSGVIGRVAAEGAGLEGGHYWEKGSVWHLDTSPWGRVVAGRYEAPPVTTS